MEHAAHLYHFESYTELFQTKSEKTSIFIHTYDF